MSPHILTRIVVLFVVFEKSFNEFDTKVDVIQLAVGIQLLVQHVGVERDLIEKISEEFVIPDLMPFAFAGIACQLLVRQIHSTHLVIVCENGFGLHFLPKHEMTEWKPFDLCGRLTAQQHRAYLSIFEPSCRAYSTQLVVPFADMVYP